MLITGKPVRNAEILLQRADGKTFYASLNVDPLLDEHGAIYGAICVFQEVGNYKQAQKELSESENRYERLVASLEHIVEEKSKDLLIKNLELKASEERYHKMVEDVEDYAIILLDETGNIRNWNKGAEKIKGYTEEEIVGKNFQIFYPEDDKKRGVPQGLLEEAKTAGKAISEGWRRKKDGNLFWASIVITALRNESGLIGLPR